jgi:hypothetical protein
MANELSAKDFSFDKDVQDSKKYISNKPFLVYEKKYEEDFHLFIQKGLELENCIQIINEYIHWLSSSESKHNLIAYFNQNIETDKSHNEKWYNELDVYTVSLYIKKDEELFCEISFGDNYFDGRLLDLELKGKYIESLMDWEDYESDDNFDDEGME